MHLVVGLGRQDPGLQALQTALLFQEETHLGGRTGKAGQLSDRGKGFVDGGGRVIVEIGFNHFLMCHQLTLRLTEMHFLEPPDTALDVLLKEAAQGLAAHTGQPRDLLVGQPLALKPQHFHFASNPRVGMMKTFVLQGPLLSVCERQSQHVGRLL